MEHTQHIYDTDRHFIINPVTRAVKSGASSKIVLIQNDHNSERFTFELPRYVEGHDMSECDAVRVHYINTDHVTKEQNKGVYEVLDVQISPENDEMVILSWLISGNSTKLVGGLSFLLRFTCTDEEGHLSYVWNTAIFSKVYVSAGIDNSEVVTEIPPDILESWHAEVMGDVLEAAKRSENAATRAEKAANEVDETVRDALQKAKDSGEFKGEQGEQGKQGIQGKQGEQGAQGESGVTVPADGFFTLSVDPDGNLFVNTTDGENPGFVYDEETGNLYFDITED